MNLIVMEKMRKKSLALDEWKETAAVGSVGALFWWLCGRMQRFWCAWGK